MQNKFINKTIFFGIAICKSLVFSSNAMDIEHPVTVPSITVPSHAIAVSSAATASAYSASSDTMELGYPTFAVPSSSGAINSNVPENFIKIIETGLEYSIALKSPNAFMEYYKAQYGGKAANLTEVFSTFALGFSQLTSERIKNIMMLLTNYIAMSTDIFASNYSEIASAEGVSLKMLDRITALTRKQRVHATGGRIYFANGNIFEYEAILKSAASKRKEIHGKHLENPIHITDIGY